MIKNRAFQIMSFYLALLILSKAMSLSFAYHPLNITYVIIGLWIAAYLILEPVRKKLNLSILSVLRFFIFLLTAGVCFLIWLTQSHYIQQKMDDEITCYSSTGSQLIYIYTYELTKNWSPGIIQTIEKDSFNYDTLTPNDDKKHSCDALYKKYKQQITKTR